MQPPKSQKSPWAGTTALFPTVSEQSVVHVRRAGAYLRTRCGTLEEAFRALDPSMTGSLTLQDFVRGMETLGFEGTSAEMTQVFQAMDTGFRGSVGVASFIMAFNDGFEDSLLSLQSTRAVASSLTGADGPTDQSRSSCHSNFDSASRDRDLDMSSQTRRILEEMLEDKLACSVMRLEADLNHLREQFADCQRSTKAETQRLETKCMGVGACSAAVETLNGKMELLQRQLRDADLAATQQQQDSCATGKMIESNTSETRVLLQTLQTEFKEKVALMQHSMDGTMQAFRVEMRQWLDEERVVTDKRIPTLVTGLTNQFEQRILEQAAARAEELQRRIVEQATARAWKEASAVTCQEVKKGFATWQKECSVEKTYLGQMDERLSKLEKRWLSSAPQNAGADGNALEKKSERLETPDSVRVEGMLKSILEKLDNKVLNGFKDLSAESGVQELSRLFKDPSKKGNIRDLGPKSNDVDNTTSTTSERSAAELSSASNGPEAVNRRTSQGAGIQKLREDLFGYLSSEFQDAVSQTIAGINNEASSRQVADSPSVRARRELSPPRPFCDHRQWWTQPQPQSIPVSPALNHRQLGSFGASTDLKRSASIAVRLEARAQQTPRQYSPSRSMVPQAQTSHPVCQLPNVPDKGPISVPTFSCAPSTPRSSFASPRLSFRGERPAPMQFGQIVPTPQEGIQQQIVGSQAGSQPAFRHV